MWIYCDSHTDAYRLENHKRAAGWRDYVARVHARLIMLIIIFSDNIEMETAFGLFKAMCLLSRASLFRENDNLSFVDKNCYIIFTWER